MLISDILRTKGQTVVTVRPDQTVKDAVERLAEHRIGALVVMDGLKPVGVFSERDLVNRLAKNGARAYQFEVRELMSTPVISGVPTDTIDETLQLMTRKRIRHLPILMDGELVGVVSLGDLVKYRFEEKELEAGVLLDRARMRM
jgi:CBS domain-containing protein